MKGSIFLLVFFLFVACNFSGESDHSESVVVHDLPSDDPIIGKWLVMDSEMVPFDHISYCKGLGLGAVFEFEVDRTLKVYPALDKKACEDNHRFSIDSNRLQMLEYDMFFHYGIEKFTDNSLVLRVYSIPESYMMSGKTKEDKLKEIRNEGFLVYLKKIEEE